MQRPTQPPAGQLEIDTHTPISQQPHPPPHHTHLCQSPISANFKLKIVRAISGEGRGRRGNDSIRGEAVAVSGNGRGGEEEQV